MGSDVILRNENYFDYCISKIIRDLEILFVMNFICQILHENLKLNRNEDYNTLEVVSFCSNRFLDVRLIK